MSEEKLSLRVSWIWGCAACYYFYQFILRVLPGILAKDIMGEIGFSELQFGIMASLYSLAYSSFQLPIGMIADRLGTRIIIITGCLLATSGVFLFSIGQHPVVMMIGRFFMGAGASVGFLSCVKLATVLFPHRYLTRVNGFLLTLGTTGATVGGKPFALLADALGWRYALIVLGALGLGIGVLLIVFVRNPRTKKTAPKENAHQDSLWDGLRFVLKSPACWWIAIYNLFMYIPLAGLADLWGVHFFSHVYHFDRPQAACICMNLYIGMAVGCPFWGWFSETMKSRRYPMIISSVGVFALLSLVIFSKPLSLTWLEVIMVGTGFFIGAKTLGFAYVCEVVPHNINGTAIGFVNTFCMASGVLIQPLVGGILTFIWSGECTASGERCFSHTEFAWALGTIPLVVFLAIFIALFLPESYRSDKNDASFDEA